MSSKGDGRKDSTAPAGRGRGWITGLVKLVALAVGAVISVVVSMSLVGLLTDNVWVQLGVAVVVTGGLPLLMADRLLPDDGSSRPGLVTDVAAVTWMGGATAAVALGTSMLQGPLSEQASRFDAQGWNHVAWGTRWVAGVQTPTAASPAASEEEAATPAATEPPVEVEAVDAAPAEGAEFTPAPPKEQPRKELAPAELFKAWAPSVVTIKTEMSLGAGMGTGFVIDDKGTIATNHHVVEDARKIEVKLFDGSVADEVELLENNPDDDLALLRIKIATLPPPVALGVSDEVEVGEAVIVIGNPIGLEHTMTDGMVSSRRVYEGKKYIQMSAPVSPGNSGGPVFNTRGDVIGVTVAKLRGESLNLAIPIDVLKPMIKSEYPAARGFGTSRW
ncbi:trypsin-like peptidase domain-containing protein [Paraliomyxa miuraensis]|uniref:trypsin-like peptidase domain-containing protein n=1 Tax=Paraliomyxa miuraensis TaxID=376150 RepID=UPI002258E458|nr:trypsin-like peptidase domain-containing protein [Paraliomyxa miuraensis]MCX4244110.1 trypsin-like peptidase domain-containing protein [Paraliomyxa miuraensis]